MQDTFTRADIWASWYRYMMAINSATTVAQKDTQKCWIRSTALAGVYRVCVKVALFISNM